MAIALFAVLATGYAGAAKLKTKSESTTVSFESQGDVEATCKKGTKAISGGFDADLSFSDGFLLVYESMKTGGRRWETAAFNEGDPGSLTSFAYCRDAKVKRRSAETTLDEDEDGSAIATCPKGTKAISGGFDNPEFGKGGSAILPYESRRLSKREWIVSGVNFADPGTLVAQVVCRKGKKVKTASDSDFADHADTYSPVAGCPRGARAISGGFDSTLPPDGSIDGPFVYSSKKEGKRSWEVSYFDFLAAATFTAYAYCEKT
jgi:hypothetical protein